MKIWYGNSSEHSSEITIIASFKSREQWENAKRKLENRQLLDQFGKTERQSLYTPFSEYHINDRTSVHECKNNKLLIFTDDFIYTAIVELLLSEGADIELAGDNYPVEDFLNTPDIRETAEQEGIWFDDMDDQLDDDL